MVDTAKTTISEFLGRNKIICGFFYGGRQEGEEGDYSFLRVRVISSERGDNVLWEYYIQLTFSLGNDPLNRVASTVQIEFISRPNTARIQYVQLQALLHILSRR